MRAVTLTRAPRTLSRTASERRASLSGAPARNALLCCARGMRRCFRRPRQSRRHSRRRRRRRPGWVEKNLRLPAIYSEASMLPPSPAPRAAAARAVPKKKAVAAPPSDEDVPIATMTGRAAKLPEARARAPKRRVVDDTEETPAPATPSKSRRNA